MDHTLCSVCQDEHCTPWQTQTARFLEVEQPEMWNEYTQCYLFVLISILPQASLSAQNTSIPEQWQCGEERLAARQQWRRQP